MLKQLILLKQQELINLLIHFPEFRQTLFDFPGVERCPAGWPIREQEPDSEANDGVEKKSALT